MVPSRGMPGCDSPWSTRRMPRCIPSSGCTSPAWISAGLATAFVTDGQRVPEDLQAAKAHPLVARAAELLAENPIALDPGYLALAFGGANAHVNG